MRVSVIAVLPALFSFTAAFSQFSDPLVYFRQDFCAPDLVFQGSPPDMGQADYVITTSSASVSAGDCFYDAIRTEPTGGGSVRIIRTTPFTSPATETLHARIEMEPFNISNEGTIAAYFGIGNEISTTTTLIPNASLFSKLSVDFRNDGTYNLRISGSSGAILSDPLSGRITITWAMNNSASDITYFSPLETQSTLEPGKFDIWINTDRWIAGADRISDIPLNNFAFVFSNGVGTLRLHHLEISNNGFQLPLILTGFKAERRLYESLIQWNMESGHTASHFMVERSTDGYHFEKIGSVRVEHETQNRYSFADTSPRTGLNYYRLKMVGNDGEVKYSPLDLVYFDVDEPVITLAPNPAAADKIRVLAAGVDPQNIMLLGTNGRRIKFTSAYNSADHILSIYPPFPLPSGIYLLKLNDGRALKTVKVVIP